ncbi:EF-P lysine aminoacylase EpmA [Telmatospirillum siberiense]|uniref:EF-P lysine aminoacylase GenX n=1 Tax=Telmatospirillum siberiense TaxID=382514 RepID=A0A2N3Q171_9PROT|nr:EF-P lysine aminoacylase EpmA [Telmatospirillum siberiense]PKU26404.1 EF-P lysine aminoacylase GenX [Telmatospirillum siberiense]
MSGKEWWRPEDFALRQPTLLARARIMAAIRGFFGNRGFVEVETPCLQRSPGLEPHIMALSTELAEPFGASRQKLYLHTSPEFAMKKLLVAGMPRIFQFAHVWRDAERSPTHHPEFTMLEWYRAGAGYEALMEDCAAIMASAARAVPAGEFRRGDRRCDPFAAPRKLSVAEAFFEYSDIDLLASIDDPTRPDVRVLATAARERGLHVGETDSWEDVFFRVMMERIEPFLGDGVPLILHDYPVPLAALSRPRPDDPRLAERFELYACGVELANGFGELTDAAEQRRRFEADMDLKERLYGVRYPVDEDFLAALELGLPDCAGIALGVDRLVMLATGSLAIDDVLWAPVVG